MAGRKRHLREPTKSEAAPGILELFAEFQSTGNRDDERPTESIPFLSGKPCRTGPGFIRGLTCLLLGLSIAASIIFLPWSNEWPYRFSGTDLKTLPPRPPSKEGNLPQEAYRKAVQFLKENRSIFSNRRFMTIIDYTKPSTSRRFFLVNLESGEVQRFLVSHGKNSGWLYATRFSNRPESFQTPAGFFRTGAKYYGCKGPSLELHGLEKGVNDNAMSRGIVMHGADYASPRAIMINRWRLGRSLGCPAIPMEVADKVIDKIKKGSLLYIYTGAKGPGTLATR